MTTRTCIPLLLALILVGCDRCGDAEPPAPAPTATSLPANLFVSAPPSDAQDVAALKRSAREGERVTIRGRVGGHVRPFTEGRSVMLIADLTTLKGCVSPAESEEGCCETPWDYCCDPPEDLLAGTATIQIVGPDGRPLKVGLEGAGGLAPLSDVIVTGNVGPRPDPKVLVIRAETIYVAPADKPLVVGPTTDQSRPTLEKGQQQVVLVVDGMM